MILKEKERSVIEDLQTQEKSCVEKYGKYAEQARDPELKNLFRNIQQEEQKHYESLSMILSGSVPECNCNDRSGKDYQPKAVYTAMSSPEDKQHDAFLATDCIGTEKLVSGTYNDDVFAFEDSGVRKLLADIQIEEQNHAEMLYKYKTVMVWHKSQKKQAVCAGLPGYITGTCSSLTKERATFRQLINCKNKCAVLYLSC